MLVVNCTPGAGWSTPEQTAWPFIAPSDEFVFAVLPECFRAHEGMSLQSMYCVSLSYATVSISRIWKNLPYFDFGFQKLL